MMTTTAVDDVEETRAGRGGRRWVRSTRSNDSAASWVGGKGLWLPPHKFSPCGEERDGSAERKYAEDQAVIHSEVGSYSGWRR